MSGAAKKPKAPDNRLGEHIERNEKAFDAALGDQAARDDVEFGKAQWGEHDGHKYVFCDDHLAPDTGEGVPEGVEDRAREMLRALIGNSVSDTTLRVATDWLKQEARLATPKPADPTSDSVERALNQLNAAWDAEERWSADFQRPNNETALRWATALATNAPEKVKG